MALNTQRLVAALEALEGQRTQQANVPSTSNADFWKDFSDHASAAAKKPSGGFDWKGALSDALNVVTVPLHTITSAAVTGGREVGKYGFHQDYGANDPTLKNMLGMIVDPKQEVNFGDVVSGKPEKGLTAGVFDVPGRTPAGSLTGNGAPALARSALGVAGDVAMDPLSYVEGGGAAKELLGREAAQSTARQALAQSAKEGGIDLSKEAIAEAISKGGDHAEVLGKIREAAGDSPEVQRILNEGSGVAARARRYGVAHLTPEEIGTYLTKEGTLEEPLAHRGLDFAHKLIPGTDTGLGARLGELKANASAKLGDLFGGSTADKAFTEQTTRELTAAARSGDAKTAYESILTKAARDTSKHGARALIAGWSGKLASLTKDFSDEDMARLRPALEGDEAAIAALEGKHEGVRTLLDDIHTRATEAGLNINKIADYAPRELSPEGRQLLQSKGFFNSDRLGPLASFEKARSLVPDADGLYHFGGETFKASSNAEVSSKVNEIARAALAKVDPEAAKNMQGFFNSDAKSSINHYIGRAARRISESDAATRLYAMGIGNAKFRTVADTMAQHAAEGARDAATEADHQSLIHLERATLHEGAQDEIGRHLLGQRLGQLDESLKGTPVTSPLSDAQDAGLAAAAHGDAQAAVVDAHARLDSLDAAAQARVEAGSASAVSLTEDINNLRSKLATSSDPTFIEGRIRALENEHLTWISRRDATIDAALQGRRSDVLMPKGFKTIEGEVTPIGGFKEVAPKVAWRNAGAVHEAVQDATSRGAALAEAKGEFARAVLSGQDGRAAAAEAFDKFVGIASPHQGDLAEAADHSQKLGALIDSHYTPDGALDVPKMRRTMDRVMAAVEKDKALAQREQVGASKLAEQATRRSDGIVEGALYHGTPQRWLNDALGPRTAENTMDTLDLGGLYTTDDQTGKILIGERPMSEKPDMRGYTAPPGLNPHEIPGGTVYSYVPRDPSTTLMPTDAMLHVDDLPPQMHALLDEFYGGDNWNGFHELSTGDPHLDELANDVEDPVHGVQDGDPIAAFLAHDMVQHAQQRGLTSLTTEDLVNAYYSSDMMGSGAGQSQGFLGAMRREFANAAERETSTAAKTEIGTAITRDSEAAAAHVNSLIDHWYDDYGIKGYTREGGGITGRAATSPHIHSIWVRPNDDLEMVGKADFSAAWAEKRARQALQDKASLTDALKIRSADEATLGAKTEELDALTKKIAGTPRPTVARQRAALAVQSAEDQAAKTEQYMTDTVDAIKARRAAHLDETHRITALLANPAPLPADAVEHMRSYIEDLHQSVLYGRVHEKALEVGDRQLQRYASLEQAAAEASAKAHDLHQQALSFGDMADRLSDKTIQQVSDAFNAGATQELRPGIGTPEDIANWLHGAQPYSSVEGMRKFFKQTDKVVQWIKDWQIATPAFGVRNLMGGEFLNAEAGVSMESRYAFIKAYSKELRGKPLTDAEASIMADVRKAVGRGQTEAETSPIGMDSALASTRDGKGTILPSRNNYLVRGSQRVSRQIDFYNRGVLAWHTMSNGGTLDDAVAAVNRFHFDYSDLSHFEQNLRHVVPFYTFTRKNLPLQVEQIINNPKIYARLAAVKYETENVSSADKTVPSYYGDMLGIRLPWEHNGGHMYATPDLPATSLENFSSPRQAENNVLGMISPLFKAPIERHFSQQFFEGIPLSDKKAVPVPLPAMLTKGLAPVLEATGLAKNVDGHLFMTEKNAYVLGQFVPVIARYSRMMPADQKGRSRQLAQLLTWAGFRVEDNSTETQKSYLQGKKFQKQDAAATDKAFVKAAKKLEAGK